MSIAKKVALAALAIALFIGLGLAGTDEMKHDQHMAEQHPEWAQFYKD